MVVAAVAFTAALAAVSTEAAFPAATMEAAGLMAASAPTVGCTADRQWEGLRWDGLHQDDLHLDDLHLDDLRNPDPGPHRAPAFGTLLRDGIRLKEAAMVRAWRADPAPQD